MNEQNDRSGDVDPFAVAVSPEVAARHRPPVYPREIPGDLGAIVREHAGAIVAARPADGCGFVFLDLRGQSADVAALSVDATDGRIPRSADDEPGLVSELIFDAAERSAAVRLVVVAAPVEVAEDDDAAERVAIVLIATREDVQAARMSLLRYCSGFRLWDPSPTP
jgi:hypothetical protein